MERVYVAFSGGLDSTFLCIKLLHLSYDVIPVHFIDPLNFNINKMTSKSALVAEKAYQWIKSVKKKNQSLSDMEISLPIWDPCDTYEVPARNFIILNNLYHRALDFKTNNIAIGVFGQNAYPDTSERFIKSYKETLASLKTKIKLITLQGHTKANILCDLEQIYKLSTTDFVRNVSWCLDYKNSYNCDCSSCARMRRSWNLFAGVSHEFKKKGGSRKSLQEILQLSKDKA